MVRLRRRQLAVTAAAVLLLLVVGVELVAGLALGVDRYVLYIRDPEIEYLVAPNQDFHRFGRRVLINRFSQRSADVPRTKTNPSELRILLLGDSIVFGGIAVDQAATVGTLLEDGLTAATRRPVRVLTAAANSWGPANEAAYLRRFGTFDADLVLWVVPSGDWFDAPGDGSIVGRDPDFPVRNPPLATTEIVRRYIWDPVIALAGIGTAPTAAHSDLPQNKTMVDAIQRVRAAGIPVALVHWPTQAALEGQIDPRPLTSFFADARTAGADVIDLTSALAGSTSNVPSIYRDTVHPTPSSIRWLSQQLQLAVLSVHPETIR